jgi:murein DD-endopeptidase MepM/ murein hydrolase activator NlpD
MPDGASIRSAHNAPAGLSRLGVCLLAVFLALFGAAVAAYADGLIVSEGSPGGAGPQIDAVELSHAERQAPIASAQPRTYLVQRGDTLSSIASRNNTTVASLVARNGLANADRIDAGRALQIDTVVAPLPSLPPDGPLTRVQFWPWPPVQGQTLAVWLIARTPMTPVLSFAGQPISLTTEGRSSWAMIPIDALASPGAKPLTLTVGATVWTMPLPIRAGVFDVDQISADAADPILSEAAKVNAELARMTELFAGASLGGWTPRSRFSSPLAPDVKYQASSPFGSRRTYGSGTGLSAHAGEDFAVLPGTPVLAPAAGAVVLAERLFVRGNAVVIDHGRGVYSGYWHMQSLNVKAGDQVLPGQVLGLVGNTGLSTGAHLHWEMRVDGVAVDPLQWVEN